MSTPESPTTRKPASQFAILEDPPSSGSRHNSTVSEVTGDHVDHQNELTIFKAFRTGSFAEEDPVPLLTNKLGNQSPLASRKTTHSIEGLESMDKSSEGEKSSLDALLNQLTRQNAPDKNNEIMANKPNEMPTADIETDQVLRLRKELEDAKGKIAKMDQELSQSRITKHTIDQALGSPMQSNAQLKDVTEEHLNKFQNVLPSLQTTGFIHDDMTSNRSRAASPMRGGYQPHHTNDFKLNSTTYLSNPLSSSQWNGQAGQNWSKGDNLAYGVPSRMTSAPQPQRPANNFRLENVFDNDQGFYPGAGNVPNMGQFYNAFGSYPTSITPSPQFSPPMTPMSFQALNIPHAPSPYQPRPIGTPLSPTAMEFGASGFPVNAWNSQSQPSDMASGYMAPMEPMNYRRLLDRNMSCNWKYIVDKIVCSNDQQASIFLQQKLKVAPPEQKFELIEAIIAQAYPLMINRFGNFLVQRCFEHGTPEQVIAIANAIRGNTVNLSMDAFGCHVVQKAFDVVPEDYKAIMVHELLRRIPETVIHRYACHVWQKLFELRWSDSPPQIMKYVNEALRGMWHEVALGETGSLVVQNIFENCLEEDKRPCVSEVLASIDIVSHGQFGNWCIQHICEHGAPTDKSRAIEHVLRFASEYSTDQFASKVVEKCLKVGGSDFLERYLERVCEGRPDRPRMPLIDIAGDQYGNYLVQWILIHSSPQHRDSVANHVRKHMVSLRGSKFGSRVAMLCCNPAVATRPGPPVGMQMNNRLFSNGGPSRTATGPPYR